MPVFPILPSTLMLLLLVAAQAGASEAGKDACIDVAVDGYKTLSYECLGQQMTNRQGDTAARKNQQEMAFSITNRASNQLGLFNQAATSHRMGANFGRSAFPQRPVERVSR
ncbi:hypothetical protein BAY1663_00156 [Pseudomonas sp. BAY1663]|uniref:hypothetical protein n=1 Tax=Pseudomonas sp. BAY1663 TaxID=1439940 RepID=UPI00042E129C|nr:hypothetical protein [Pseudomonas sp. BAY1663]EXF47482.1 hypothetical protein BAY1663_00156 [Pseudomonas sp. BAY1663]